VVSAERNAATQETQDVGAAEGRHGVLKQSGVEATHTAVLRKLMSMTHSLW